MEFSAKNLANDLISGEASNFNNSEWHNYKKNFEAFTSSAGKIDKKDD